jgi:hypothetical protein
MNIRWIRIRYSLEFESWMCPRGMKRKAEWIDLLVYTEMFYLSKLLNSSIFCSQKYITPYYVQEGWG